MFKNTWTGDGMAPSKTMIKKIKMYLSLLQTPLKVWRRKELSVYVLIIRGWKDFGNQVCTIIGKKCRSKQGPSSMKNTLNYAPVGIKNMCQSLKRFTGNSYLRFHIQANMKTVPFGALLLGVCVWPQSSAPHSACAVPSRSPHPRRKKQGWHPGWLRLGWGPEARKGSWGSQGTPARSPGWRILMGGRTPGGTWLDECPRHPVPLIPTSWAAECSGRTSVCTQRSLITDVCLYIRVTHPHVKSCALWKWQLCQHRRLRIRSQPLRCEIPNFSKFPTGLFIL